MYEELIERLRDDTEWARANEWELPITLGDNLLDAADTIEELSADYNRLRAMWAKAVSDLSKTQAELESVKRERDVLATSCKELTDSYDLVSLACQKAEREKNAAIKDLNSTWLCPYCKEYETCDAANDVYGDGCSAWEWRGVKED